MALSKIILRKFGTSRSVQYYMYPVKYSEKKGGHGNTDIWKKVFYFCCIPAISVCGLNCYLQGTPPRPDFVAYDHLRKRAKAFPWGDGNKTLFHNPHRNALPEGYEE